MKKWCVSLQFWFFILSNDILFYWKKKIKEKAFSSEWGKKTVLLQAFENSFCVYLLTNQQQLSNGPTISSADKDGKNVLEHKKFLFWA